jgi:hypothetical protein
MAIGHWDNIVEATRAHGRAFVTRNWPPFLIYRGFSAAKASS